MKWYDNKDPHNDVFTLVKRLEIENVKLTQRNIRNFKLYGDLQTDNPVLNYFSSTAHAPGRLTYNVVKTATDTVASKIGKMRPRVDFLTDEGDWSLQQKAKKLSKYIEGVFYKNKLYKATPTIFTDACVFDTAFLKIYHDGEDVKIERVLPLEIVVDPEQSVYGNPTELHQVKYMSRGILEAMYPNHLLAITSASASNPNISRDNKDVVKVIESWKLPSGPNGKDGKHSIVIDTATLLIEDYEKDYFPFVKFSWTEPLVGFRGASLTDELVGIQYEINKLLQNISKAQDLMAVPRIFIESSSAVPKTHINNQIGAIVRYSGKAPITSTPNAMPAEMYNHLKWLISSAFEKSGISQLSAQAKKPSGIDSGVAIREIQDIESERFMLISQRFEQMFIDLSEIVIDLSKDLYEDSDSINIKSEDFVQTIKWSEVNLDKDAYVMKSWPTNMLPNTPGGKLQSVQELIQAGFIDAKDAMRLLDFPDLKEYQSLKDSNIELIHKLLSSMMEGGKYEAPDSTLDLELSSKLGQQYQLKARETNAPDSVIENLLRWMDDVNRLIAKLTPPAPIAAPADPTIATPEAQPQSDLLSVVPEEPVI